MLTPTFVFNSYYHRSLEGKSHTIDLKKVHYYSYHKKNSTDHPGNFRPITLEAVTLKILTPALGNKVCQFLSYNSYIETNIQKGLVNGISGAFEHTNYSACVINNARKSKQSLIVTQLDLRREVHYLKHHHVQECIRQIVENLYCCFKTYNWLMTSLLTSHI